MFKLVSTNTAAQTIDFTFTCDNGAQSGVVQAKREGRFDILFSSSFVWFLIVNVLGVSEKTARSRIRAQGLERALSETFFYPTAALGLIKRVAHRNLGGVWIMSKNKMAPFADCESAVMVALDNAIITFIKATAAAKKAQAKAAAEAKVAASQTTAVTKTTAVQAPAQAAAPVTTTEVTTAAAPAPASASAPALEQAHTPDDASSVENDASSVDQSAALAELSAALSEEAGESVATEPLTTTTEPGTSAVTASPALSTTAPSESAAAAPDSKDSPATPAPRPCGGPSPRVPCDPMEPSGYEVGDDEVGFIVGEDGAISHYSDPGLMRAEMDNQDPEYDEGMSGGVLPRGCGAVLEGGSAGLTVSAGHGAPDLSDAISGPCYDSEAALERDLGDFAPAYIEPEDGDDASSIPPHRPPRPCGSAFGWSDDEPFWRHIFGC